MATVHKAVLGWQGMPRRAITQEVWDALVASFRNAPAGYSQAARAAGCDRRTATKAYEKGLEQWGEHKPIKDIILAEQTAARAAIQREQVAKAAMQEKERDDARKQAVESRKVEGQLVALARANSLNALAATAQVFQLARQLAARVRAKLEKIIADDQAADQAICEHCGRAADTTPINVAISLLHSITALGRRVNEQALDGMRMERVHLGEPTEIIGIKEDAKAPISKADAESRLAIAKQAVERALSGKVFVDMADPKLEGPAN